MDWESKQQRDLRESSVSDYIKKKEAAQLACLERLLENQKKLNQDFEQAIQIFRNTQLQSVKE